MKKWESLEDKINLTLIKKYERFIKKLKMLLVNAKKNTVIKINDFYNKIIPYIINAQEILQRISKTKPNAIVETVKKLIKEINLKNFISLIKAPPYKEFGQFIRDNKINTSFVLIFIFGITNLINEIRSLAPNNNSRSITSKEESSERPSYYLLKGKLLKIENIMIPVSLNQNKRISSIIADVVIECPNRTAQQFLYNSPHLIQDKLNNTIAPQINTFPLTEEGKVILRKKIQIELSNLLKENHFTMNQIKRVNIIQVTSS